VTPQGIKLEKVAFPEGKAGGEEQGYSYRHFQGSPYMDEDTRKIKERLKRLGLR
jgi:hypothetical protein